MGLLYFVSYAIVMLPIYYYNFPFFEQYKISNKPWAWRSVKESDRDQFWSLAKKSLKLFFFNYCILVPMLTAGKYFTFNTPMSFSTDDWPSYTTLARDNILMTFTHEFFFYWAHRISHIRGFYKYHKVCVYHQPFCFHAWCACIKKQPPANDADARCNFLRRFITSGSRT